MNVLHESFPDTDENRVKMLDAMYAIRSSRASPTIFLISRNGRIGCVHGADRIGATVIASWSHATGVIEAP